MCCRRSSRWPSGSGACSSWRRSSTRCNTLGAKDGSGCLPGRLRRPADALAAAANVHERTHMNVELCGVEAIDEAALLPAADLLAHEAGALRGDMPGIELQAAEHRQLFAVDPFAQMLLECQGEI